MDGLLFTRSDYQRTLGLGVPEDGRARHPLLVREIPGTDLRDGVLPWPYSDLNAEELLGLRAASPDLVSIVGNLSPATPPDEVSRMQEAGLDVVRAKEHFVLDPRLPMRAWSASTRSKIRRAQQQWSPGIVMPDSLPSVLEIYRSLVRRRELAGTFWDFSDGHFDLLLRDPAARVVGMFDAQGTLGCFACLVRQGDDLHGIHMAGSVQAHDSWGMYALLAELVGECRETGARLFLGGAPRGSRAGSESFKARWSNTTLPVVLVRMVVDAGAYERLPAVAPAGYFPAYRETW